MNELLRYLFLPAPVLLQISLDAAAEPEYFTLHCETCGRTFFDSEGEFPMFKIRHSDLTECTSCFDALEAYGYAMALEEQSAWEEQHQQDDDEDQEDETSADVHGTS